VDHPPKRLTKRETIVYTCPIEIDGYAILFRRFGKPSCLEAHRIGAFDQRILWFAIENMDSGVVQEIYPVPERSMGRAIEL
jgi:hypothetical protein